MLNEDVMNPSQEAPLRLQAATPHCLPFMIFPGKRPLHLNTHSYTSKSSLLKHLAAHKSKHLIYI